MGRDLLAALLGAENGAELSAALDLGSALRIIRPVPDSTSYAIHGRIAQIRRAQAPIAARPDWAAQQCARVTA